MTCTDHQGADALTDSNVPKEIEVDVDKRAAGTPSDRIFPVFFFFSITKYLYVNAGRLRFSSSVKNNNKRSHQKNTKKATVGGREHACPVGHAMQTCYVPVVGVSACANAQVEFLRLSHNTVSRTARQTHRRATALLSAATGCRGHTSE
ncbi:hypothetical protein D623_10020230 [Myotis brandtii]|uniref:Uncharacterized protein n=1 Tax=Myotis brandtii TaxID=109478 RepID=S7NGY7_MYOBR|nr:hypothetical protein D623_10020230 [Myotis brandtii]